MQEQTHKPLQVLILADLPDDAELMVYELRRAGFAPQWRRVATEAEYLAALDPALDLILADYILPGCNGLRALELLRARGLDIPLILVSSTLGEEIAVAAMQCGAADYLLKDRLTRLGLAVTQALEQRHLRIERQRAETALQEQAKLQQAVLHALTAEIAVLDPTGFIITVNNAWTNFACRHDDSLLYATGVGVNYLDTCRHAANHDHDAEAALVLAGLQAIIDRQQTHFTLEYSRQTPSEWRWFVMHAMPLDDQGGVVITHEDITARKQAEQELRQKAAFIQLFQEVAVAANQATALEQALQTAVNTICTHIGWPIGHVYLPDLGEPGALLPTSIWHLDDMPRFATFRTITEVVRLAPGIGLPGQALASRKPVWIADMVLDVNTPRTRLIKDIGIRAGFALPVLVGDDVAAVLEFFATEAIMPDAALLEVLHHVGTQLGRVVERARAEAELRMSEDRFRVLFAHSPDSIMLIDPHVAGVVWPIIECNAVACQMNGYTRDELIGQSIDLLNPSPGTWEQRTAHIARLRREGTVPYETMHRRKDGSLFPIEIVSSLIAVGGRELVLGIDRDISERKRAEAALQAAEGQYRTLVEQLPAIIYTAAIDELSSTSYVSPQIEAILGFSPEEWLANPNLWLEQVHPEDRTIILEAIERAHKSVAPVPLEYRSFTRDGQLIWLSDAAQVVCDEAGQPLFLQGISLDITERKNMEEALRISAARFRAVWESAHDAMLLVDPNGMILDANPAFYQLYGYPTNQIIGHAYAIIFPKEQRANAMENYRTFFHSPQLLAKVESIVYRADGTACWVESSMSFIVQGGQRIALLSLIRDITERKRMEEALSDERALLARRVDERTADLSAANAELARAARLKDEFLASMSHELRTPLNAVLGLSEALQEQVYGPLNDRQHRSLRSIEESGRHLLELINDILDLAKIGAGKLDLYLEPTAIEEICYASLRLIKQLADQKRLSVKLKIDPAVTLLHVDARRVKQILVNLLSNAVKFTPEGGSIGLEMAGDATRQAVDLTVWDTGIGIAEEQMTRLFQPFVQLDSRLARQYQGTGLGLVLVYRMVELHSGSIAVTSTVGRGSRFTVALPWHTANVDAPASKPAAPNMVVVDHTINRPAHTAASVVLLAEDNEATITMISDYLSMRGYHMAVARNGAEAIARAHELQPAIILMDIQMPGMDGLEAIRRIRSNADLTDLPIIALTALAMPGDRERCLAAGATAYLSKPVSLRGLASLIETTLPE